jgi:S-formylglutathione hydrolase FrmB
MGIGAGFYVNATEEPYNKHYKMYTYITEELPALLEKEFKIGMFGLRAISGQ